MLLSTAYFPPVAYFQKIASFPRVYQMQPTTHNDSLLADPFLFQMPFRASVVAVDKGVLVRSVDGCVVVAQT